MKQNANPVLRLKDLEKIMYSQCDQVSAALYRENPKRWGVGGHPPFQTHEIKVSVKSTHQNISSSFIGDPCFI